MFSTGSVFSFIFPIMALGFLISALVRRGQVLKQKTFLEHQANRLGGKVVSRFLGLNLTLELERNAVTVKMRCRQANKNRVASTRAWAKTNAPAMLNFNIHGENVITKVTKFFAGKDIEVGNPEFDKRFVVNCKDEEFIRRFLDAELQQMLLKLDDSLKATIRLYVALSELVLETDYLPIESEDYRILIDGFLGILNKFDSINVSEATGAKSSD